VKKRERDKDVKKRERDKDVKKRERDKDVKKQYFLFQWKITMNSKQISFKS
jgi:hypothetical protein